MCEVHLKPVDLHPLLTSVLIIFNKKSWCCSLSAQRVEELEEALKKKDEDMKQMEERYKKYLEKAKSVSILLLLKTELITKLSFAR